MKRPVGVTILAVIGIVYGIFTLLVAFLGVVGLGLGVLAPRLAAVAIKYSAGTLLYATISDVILGILYLAFGIGALRLKGWAWIVGVVAVVLDIVRQIVGIVTQGFSATKSVGAIITIVIALVLLWYLFRSNVRAAFGKAV